MGKNQILVEREIFEKDGKNYYSYFIKGKLRNKDIRIAVVPPDRGGYTVLDVVFGDKMSAELLAKPFEIKDDISGKVISGNSYVVHSVDSDGQEYECAIKPYRNSDKALLNMLYKNFK